MCVTSMIADDWLQRTNPLIPSYIVPNYIGTVNPPPSRLEFDALKAEVESLKKLLSAAKKYDEETNQPNCEMEDKVALIKKIAKAVGVDLEDVFANHK